MEEACWASSFDCLTGARSVRQSRRMCISFDGVDESDRFQDTFSKNRILCEDFSGTLVASALSLGINQLAHPPPQLQCHQCEDNDNPSSCMRNSVRALLDNITSLTYHTAIYILYVCLEATPGPAPQLTKWPTRSALGVMSETRSNPWQI